MTHAELNDSANEGLGGQKLAKVVKIARPPPFNKRQLVMVIVFMVLEGFYSLLTLSLGPIASSVKKVYKLDDDYLFYLELCPVAAVITGYYPTFKILNAMGLKNGLSLCLLISLLGALAQYFTNQNKWLFLVGQFIILFGLQSLHTAKGVFVNVFFQEKNRGRALILITSMMVIGSVAGSLLVHWLILRSEVLILPEEVVASRLNLYMIVRISTAAFITLATLVVFQASPGSTEFKSTPSNDREESQLMYQYAGFNIPLFSQLKELFADKVYLMFVFGTSIGIAGIEGTEDGISYFLAHYGISRTESRIIRSLTLSFGILGIIAYVRLFLMKSHQLFFLMFNNFILSAFFLAYWYSFRFGYWVTLAVAAPFGLFSIIPLVIALEQTLRYLNRVHSEKILAGTSFYLMLMGLLRASLKLLSEYVIGPQTTNVGLYTVCILVQVTLVLTSFAAYLLNRWLNTRNIDLDRTDAGPIVVKASGAAANTSTYGEDLEVEMY